MNSQRPFGIYLYKKETQDRKVLKDLLQLLKTNCPAKGNSFSYIEAETSLHPHLSLWDNLQIEIGPSSLKELEHTLKPEWLALLSLLKQPHQLTQDSQTWEKFMTSLLKGLMNPSQNLLIDMNEDLFSPFMLQSFKKSVMESTKDKTIYLATNHTSLWLDCAHTLVGRNGYAFDIQTLDPETVKKHWVA
ncbi:hypothetical protein ACJVC5_14465 [Peredibacter sp. HCB2-198]|uniref:hypothetical protein n=1 Tax=Peredibacter sp. HCB2-198 TaxID=3383025 RepID=UPI0038B67123